jgi:predicted anti-sigma-YlaC factor YlaD
MRPAGRVAVQDSGNYFPRTRDCLVMGCEDLRVALSARLDGEDPGASAQVLDGHLIDCPDCRSWLGGALGLAAPVRALREAPVVDRTETIMAAVAADGAVRPPAAAPVQSVTERWVRVLRAAVAGSAAVQLSLAMPSLLASVGAVSAGHLDRELGAFDAALATGFLLVAARPALARAYAPLAWVLAVLLAVTSGADLIQGATTLGHETIHLACVVQAALLSLLARLQPGRFATLATNHSS